MKKRKIGDVARQLGLSERRIREYERAGLIRPRRQPRTDDRLFDDTDVAQLQLFKRLIHDKGLTIDAIKHLLRYAPCWTLTACDRRHDCVAFLNPDRPCYEHTAAGAETACGGDCQRCPIARVAGKRPERVVIQPTRQSPESGTPPATKPGRARV